MFVTRNANLYVSSQLYRWLGWMADMKEQQDGSNQTPDGVAEALLRDSILGRLPGIEAAEAEYWRARKKLDAETVQKLNPVAPLQEAIENS